ncbi:dCTP deaminase/dUTPase family protein [Blattabacterium cuenoti]|uniref:dUTP diphosphatase n=1 Tax=Blattabacterium cuenoti TaxID=1653831 RepID=UPI00163CA764|nr:dUTP diphosphatase [Blattabacterium cuenoti]
MINKVFQLILIANIEKSIFINFLERKLIPTGIFIRFHQKMKYHFLVKKKLVEAICIIHFAKNNKENPFLDQEIKILLINVFFEKMKIQSNEQLVVVNIFQGNKIKWEKCSILNTSVRGSNSFGSTGI